MEAMPLLQVSVCNAAAVQGISSENLNCSVLLITSSFTSFIGIFLHVMIVWFWFLCSLYCTPSSLAASCSSMQCSNSNLMLGSVTSQATSAGCNVTTCSYGGFINGTILTTCVLYLSLVSSFLCFSHAYGFRAVAQLVRDMGVWVGVRSWSLLCGQGKKKKKKDLAYDDVVFRCRANDF